MTSIQLSHLKKNSFFTNVALKCYSDNHSHFKRDITKQTRAERMPQQTTINFCPPFPPQFNVVFHFRFFFSCQGNFGSYIATLGGGGEGGGVGRGGVANFSDEYAKKQNSSYCPNAFCQ